MLPFAAALAVASLGQTLVVMQGGIDLSVAGGFSLYVVILTKYPAGNNDRLWAALVIAVLAAIAAGSLNGLLIGRMRLNPDRCHAGNQRSPLRGHPLVHGGNPNDHDGAPAQSWRRALVGYTGACVYRRGGDGGCYGGRQADSMRSSLRRGRGERDGGVHGGHPSPAPPDWCVCVGAVVVLLGCGHTCQHREPADRVRGRTNPTICCRPWQPLSSAVRRSLAGAAILSRPPSRRSSFRNSTSSCLRSECRMRPERLCRQQRSPLG